MLGPSDLFELSGFVHAPLFRTEYAWEVLRDIKGYLQEVLEPNVEGLLARGETLPATVVLHDGKLIEEGFTIQAGSVAKGQLKVKYQNETLSGATVVYGGSSFLSDQVQLGRGSVVEPGALLKAGCLIGDLTEIRQGAYLRGSCLIGDRCVVGHATEAKNVIMLHDSKAGHFAYLGDSLLGNQVNLGAGTKLANLKINNTSVVLRIARQTHDTGLRKFGALLGDGVETGCNCVTSPGTILGKGAMVFPNTTVRPGYHAPRSLVR